VNEELQKSIDVLSAKWAAQSDCLAEELICVRESIPLGWYPMMLQKSLDKILSFLAYACEHPARRKRKIMDVQKMVDTWLPLIRQLATAHDVDDKDAASSQLDEYLMPVISSPVTQIREFYRELVVRMKEDKTIPWAVWRMFEFWGENVLDKITQETELKLKTELATKIAERSMAVIPREDWIRSMVGALQWRDPGKLKEIDEKLDAGHTPRVKGKESCLFLEVDGAQVML
jgi:hypothetical protein